MARFDQLSAREKRVVELLFMLIAVLPLEKLAVQVGLPDPFASSTMASDVSNLAGTITIIAIWLVVGIASGTTLLFVTISGPKGLDSHRQAAENGW